MRFAGGVVGVADVVVVAVGRCFLFRVLYHTAAAAVAADADAHLKSPFHFQSRLRLRSRYHSHSQLHLHLHFLSAKDYHADHCSQNLDISTLRPRQFAACYRSNLPRVSYCSLATYTSLHSRSRLACCPIL